MDIHLRKFNELTAEELSVWSRTQAGNEQLDSPFYRPEFAAIMHKAHNNVEVAVISEKGFPIDFFPFHRLLKSLGKPVGLTLNDAQGIIGTRAFKGDAAEIIKACNLAVWDFQRVPRSQTWCQAYEALTTKSHYIDLSQGFEVYYELLRNRGSSGSKDMQDADKNYQKLERDVGAVRLVLNYQQDDMLESFQRWKELQSKTTGVTDPLARKWVQPVLAEIMQQKQLPFMGMCVGLYAGSQLVAVELGIRSQHVCQNLGAAFDPNYLRYGPSQCLRNAYYRWAAEHGVRRIDLAHGPEDFKARIATGEHQLSEGSIAVTAFSSFVYGLGWKIRRVMEYPALQMPVRLLRNGYNRARRIVSGD